MTYHAVIVTDDFSGADGSTGASWTMTSAAPTAGVNGAAVIQDLTKLVPGIGDFVPCPVKSGWCEVSYGAEGHALPISRMIPHLNDGCGWTREQIADWLETLDADLTFRTEPVVTAARAAAQPAQSTHVAYFSLEAKYQQILQQLQAEFGLHGSHNYYTRRYSTPSSRPIRTWQGSTSFWFVADEAVPQSVGWAHGSLEGPLTTPEIPVWDDLRAKAEYPPPNVLAVAPLGRFGPEPDWSTYNRPTIEEQIHDRLHRRAARH